MKALAIKYQAMLWQYWPQINGNLVVGLTLALVTLPQAVAFSVTLAACLPISASTPPSGGAVLAILNPSPVFHGGPNTAMFAAIGVILLPVAPPFGAEYMGYALTLGSWPG
jgi:SulP family sulfate permease